MPGTIDNAVIKERDQDTDKEAKNEQKLAEQRRAEDRREGPSEQKPGDMPPEHHHSG